MNAYENRTSIATRFGILLAGGALLALTTAAAGQGQGTDICYGTPVFPEEPSDFGYFASDIGMDGDGDLAVIGHIYSNEFEEAGGSAQIFEFSAASWDEIETIAPDPLDHDTGDSFGASVDISDNYIIASAPDADSGDGAAYIFERDLASPSGQQWSQYDKLTNPDQEPSADFGGSQTTHESVAIYGRIAAVSAPRADIGLASDAGKVYIFFHDIGSNSWTHEATLAPPFPQISGFFGYSIELTNGRVIIGAPQHTVSNQSLAGEAFIFKRSATGTWSLEETLRATTPLPNDGFGTSVSIDGNAALVGAPFSADPDSGFATLFGYSVSTSAWAEVIKLKPDNGQEGQQFGRNVSISGSMALVGASSYDVPGVATNIGSGYLYQRQFGGDWAETLRLEIDAGVSTDRVGETLALGGDVAFVGVTGDEPPADGDGPASDGIPDDWLQIGSVLIFPDLPTCQ